MDKDKFKLITSQLVEEADLRIVGVRLITELSPCGDCDRKVKDRRLAFYPRGIGTIRQHWVKKCMECRTVLDQAEKITDLITDKNKNNK